MGIEFLDIWTVMHFLSGVFITATLIPSNPCASLIVCNILHFISECIENNKDPTGKVLETNINHFGDIIYFFMGSLVGYNLTEYFVENPCQRYIVLFICIIISVQEIGRELYPHNWPFGGAFSKFS